MSNASKQWRHDCPLPEDGGESGEFNCPGCGQEYDWDTDYGLWASRTIFDAQGRIVGRKSKRARTRW